MTTARPTVGLVSLGCAKNLVDSEHMAGVLLRAGFRLASRPEKAELVLLNTCAFVADAREESVDAILAACEWKGRGRCRAVIVAGCMPQRYRARLQQAIPEVDAFIGLDQLEAVGEIAARALRGESRILDVSAQSTRLFEPLERRVLLGSAVSAYVKVAEGCHHRCGFCAIPAIRGPFRSRPVDRILREAESLLERGVRELNLISQDTTAYGRDLGGGADLSALLGALEALGGHFRVRLLYGYPTGVTDRLLGTMAASSRVVPYLDIPVQHSHPDVLRAMGRGHTARVVETLAERVRERLPGAVLRTTCLVGYPGETAARFRHLRDYVQRSGFDHLGVFLFSPEEGTPAASLRGRPGRAAAERRRADLMTLQRGIVARRARKLVGREGVFLVEKTSLSRPGEAAGRTERQAPEVDGATCLRGWKKPLKAGMLLRVQYTGRAGYDLIAGPAGVRGRPAGHSEA